MFIEVSSTLGRRRTYLKEIVLHKTRFDIVFFLCLCNFSSSSLVFPFLVVQLEMEKHLVLPLIFKTTRLMFLPPHFLLQILLPFLYHLPFLPMSPLLFLSIVFLVLITLPFGCRTLSLAFLLPPSLILIPSFLLYLI